MKRFNLDKCAALAAAVVLVAVAASSPSAVAEEFEHVNEITATPSIKWLVSPVPVENADAATAEQMKPYTEKIANADVEFDMLPIPAGTFMMGSPEDEEFRNDDEGPQVEVEIEPFWMGKCEVTWDEYTEFQEWLDINRRAQAEREASEYDELAEAVARPTPAYSDMSFGMGKSGGFPAICMTQFAAKMYCKWLTARTGRYYRLPTEAEWEYACRAGTTTPYSFGDDIDDLDDYAWSFDNVEDDRYAKVGLKKPNPWGLYDMHGNVAEWCLDAYDPERYQKVKDGAATDAFDVPDPTQEYPRVVRGGSWYDMPESLRSASRSNPDGTAPSHPDWKMQDPQIPQSIWYLTDATFIGFRVVRPLEVPTEEEAKLYEPDPSILEEYKKAHGGKL